MTMPPSGPEALQAQAETLLRRHRVTPFIEIRVEETVIFKKRYIGPGRSGPNRPWQMEEVRRACGSESSSDLGTVP